MKNKLIIGIGIIILIVIVIAIIFMIYRNNINHANNIQTSYEQNIGIPENIVTSQNNTSNEINYTNKSIEEGEASNMKITLNDIEYEVRLEDNKTVTDIVNNMPLNLNLVRYAGHEYYSELPFTPVNAEDKTTHIQAGHVYYWQGWNAFVINYIDSDITPYQVVHIGEITDSSIIDILQNADENITMHVTN